MRSWVHVGVMAVAGWMIAAAAGQAQTGTPVNAPVLSNTARCPGGLRVRHQPMGGATVWTVAQEDKDQGRHATEAKGPGVHVEFDTTKRVRMLELSVSYRPAGARVMPAEPGTSAKESKKTFVLQQEPSLSVDGDLLVGRAATITRVHLVSATYGDGTVWHATSEDECSVPPSLFMLVEAKK